MDYYQNPVSSSYYDSPLTSSASDSYPVYSSSYYTSSYSAPTTYASLPSSTYPPTTMGYSATDGTFSRSRRLGHSSNCSLGSFGASSAYHYSSSGYPMPSVSATAYPSSPSAFGTSASMYSTPSEGDSPTGYSDWYVHSEYSASSSLMNPRSSHGRLKEHMCNVPGCSRSEGFTTQADLNRHQKSVHRVRGKYWICMEPTCPKYRKEFPRKDNLQDHLKRVHQLSKEQRDTLAEQWAYSKD